MRAADDVRMVALDLLLERGRLDPFAAKVVRVIDWTRELPAGCVGQPERWELKVEWLRHFPSGYTECEFSNLYVPQVFTRPGPQRLVLFSPELER